MCGKVNRYTGMVLRDTPGKLNPRKRPIAKLARTKENITAASRMTKRVVTVQAVAGIGCTGTTIRLPLNLPPFKEPRASLTPWRPP